MFSAARLHAIYRILNTPVRRYPFPHLFVENVFPDDFYAEMRRQMIEDEGYRRLVDTGRVDGTYSGERYSLFPEDIETARTGAEKKEFWRQVFSCLSDPEFMNIWFLLFGQTLHEKLNALPPALSGGRPPGEVPLYNEVFLLRDRATYSLGPHTDSPRKMVSVLFYLPPDDSQADLGTAIYVPKDRAFACPGGPHYSFEKFDFAAAMPFKPNCMVAFPQTPRSFHGVQPIMRNDAQRDLLLFDLKIQTP